MLLLTSLQRQCQSLGRPWLFVESSFAFKHRLPQQMGDLRQAGAHPENC